MADVKKCDRCKKYYDENKHNICNLGERMNEIRLTNFNNPKNYIKYDLCDECFIKLYTFLRMYMDA